MCIYIADFKPLQPMCHHIPPHQTPSLPWYRAHMTRTPKPSKHWNVNL